MCANYRPARAERLAEIRGQQPEFLFGEAYPGSIAPVLTNVDPNLWLPATFGLLPGWAKDFKLARSTYNARSETVAEKPSYRVAWKKRQLCIIPADAIYEPCYESGSPIRWRIERADNRPFGVAGLFERRLHDDGRTGWSMTMLTINADKHPLMRRFHKPSDEKRSVVILDDDAWDDWLNAKAEAEVRSYLQLFDPDSMIATSDPRR